MQELYFEFRKKAKEKAEEIRILQAEYIALEAMNEIVEEMFNDSKKFVLENNEFFATAENSAKWKKRDKDFDGRIRDDKEAFLMSDEDVAKYLQLCTQENCKRGLTDEKGYYKEGMNTSTELAHLKDKIVKFAVELLPEIPEKEILKQAVTVGKNYSWKTWNGIFELFMKLDSNIC